MSNPDGIPADPAAPADADPANPAQDTPPADPAPEAKPNSGPDTFDRPYVESLRSEAAANRTKAQDLQAKVDELTSAGDQSKTQMQAVMQALGLADSEETDPAKLLEQANTAKATIEAERDAERSELKALRIDNAVQKACSESDADTVLTAAILHTSGKLSALDPSSDDFMAQVAALVDEAVTGNPKLKASQVGAPASGPDPQKSAPAKGDPTDPEGWRAKLFPKP